jgi:hypothetical protein
LLFTFVIGLKIPGIQKILQEPEKKQELDQDNQQKNFGKPRRADYLISGDKKDSY